MDKSKCYHHGHGFPAVAGLILLIGILWLLADLEVIALDIPWVPVLVIILSLGMVVKHHNWQKK